VIIALIIQKLYLTFCMTTAKKATITTLALLLCLPAVTLAQGFDPSGGQFGALLNNILGFISRVLIPFILGIGFLFFVWGMFLYFIKGGADDEAKEKGKSLIIYALAGFVLIFIFWGLVRLLAVSTGFNQQTLDPGLIPSTPTTR
jgi:hypothetical protein